MKNLNAWITGGIGALILLWVIFGWVVSWILKLAIVAGIIYWVYCGFFDKPKIGGRK